MESPIQEKEAASPATARPATGARPGALQVITAICVSVTVLLALVAGAAAVSYGTGRFHIGERDFVQYWVTGQLLVQHENPYAVAGNLRMERSIGVTRPFPQFNITPNPPVIFWLLYPLGLVDVKTGGLLWMLLLMACLGISVWIVWNLNGRPRGALILLSLCFTPAIYCVMIGQLGILLLICVSLFLWLHKSHPFAAGAALAFCAVKPHLFVPVGVALILWAVYQRAYRVFLGLGVALAASAALAFWLDPHAWGQWSGLVRLMGLIDRPVPTWSMCFRRAVDPPATWVQFVPEAAACVWAAWYFWTRRTRWDWMDQGMLLLIVSVGCAPFAWVTDESLLLPALMAAMFRGQRSGRMLLPFVLILAGELFDLLRGGGILTTAYLWTMPAYLVWYLYATWGSAARATVAETGA